MTENEIKLDVQAEQKVFADVLPNTKNPLISETTVQESLPVAASINFTAFQQPGLNLPESVIHVPTQLDLSHEAEPQKADVSLDLKIKFDAEQSYNNVKNTVDSMQKAIQDISDGMQSKWIPAVKPINNFEEKPSLEQTNLIFEARKEQFSEYPRWA